MKIKAKNYDDENGNLCFEEDNMSDGGWIIKAIEDRYFIYEVNEFGGNEIFYGNRDNLKDALNIAVNLT